MTSSLQPLMQLLVFDDIGLSRLQRLSHLHVSVRFCEPFPMCRGHLGIFVSHVLNYYCISPDGYFGHGMYVGFIILFLWLMFRPAPISLLCSVVFRAPYSFYFVSAGIGMPPPPPLAQVPLHNLETFFTCKSHLLRV